MWNVEATDRFWSWLELQDDAIRIDMLAALKLLAQEGPHLGRPFVDTLYFSKISNMKELRVQSNGRPLRGFFVFDPLRKAIVFCAGNKAGKNEKRFYREMLIIAEQEYQLHLNSLKKSQHENT
ncbi:type II toxin-antitoxin system RelE/ParE family toxin [Pantoea sp.]|uniref:type II toxin-antitoxin system RelE/ParE family toxin n=1 Tax=Pantoea sp. TaxID=69393 RepID=UPI0031E49191